MFWDEREFICIFDADVSMRKIADFSSVEMIDCLIPVDIFMT